MLCGRTFRCRTFNISEPFEAGPFIPGPFEAGPFEDGRFVGAPLLTPEKDSFLSSSIRIIFSPNRLDPLPPLQKMKNFLFHKKRKR
jgi:hypothetical protein